MVTETKGQVIPGDSGSPVFGPGGHVVGMAVASASGQAEVVPWWTIRQAAMRAVAAMPATNAKNGGQGNAGSGQAVGIPASGQNGQSGATLTLGSTTAKATKARVANSMNFPPFVYGMCLRARIQALYW